jgi:hypothetical protein
MKRTTKIIFDKKSAIFILDSCEGMFPKKCIFCGNGITDNNLSVVFDKGYICNDLNCLIKLVVDFEKEVE